MSVPGGAAAPTEPNSTGPAKLLGLGTAVLGVLNFLLGFTAFAKIDGIAVFGDNEESARSYFQFGYPVLPLAFLLFGGLLAAIALLPKQNLDAPAAAASIVGFLTLLMLVFHLDGLTLAYGGYLVLVLAFVQAAIAVGTLLLRAGVVKPPAKKAPATPFGGYQAGPGQQQGNAQYGQQSGQYGAPRQNWGQHQGYGQQQPVQQGQPQAWGAAPQQPGYTSPYGQPAYGRPEQQYPRQDQQAGQYGGYGAPAAPTQQYQTPVAPPAAAPAPTPPAAPKPDVPNPAAPGTPAQEQDATQAFRIDKDDEGRP